jgi:hypothetical protein
VVEQFGESDIEGPVSLSASLLGQGASEEGFADAGGTGDDHVLVFLDPVAGEEPEDDGFIDSPGVFVVEVFGAGLDFEFGVFEEPLQPAVFLESPLAVNEEAEAFLEGEVGKMGLLELFFESLGHAEEFESVEFVEGLFVEHGFYSFHW